MLDNSDEARLRALAAAGQGERAARLREKYRDGLAHLDLLRPGWREASPHPTGA